MDTCVPPAARGLSKTWLNNHPKEEQKQLNLGACLKKTKIKNYIRLVAELPTTDIADYLKQNQILTGNGGKNFK